MHIGYHLLNVYLSAILFSCCAILLMMNIFMWLYYLYNSSSNKKIIQSILLIILVVSGILVIGSYFLFNPREQDISRTYNDCANETILNRPSYVFYIIVFILFYFIFIV